MGAGVGCGVGLGWPGWGANVVPAVGVGLGANPVTTPKGWPVIGVGAKVTPGAGVIWGTGVGYPFTPGIHCGS